MRDFMGRPAFCAGRAAAAASLLNASLTEQPGRCKPPSTCHLSVSVWPASRKTLKKCIFCSPWPFLTTQLSQTHLFNVSEHFPRGPDGHRGLGTQRWTRRASPCCPKSLQGEATTSGCRCHSESGLGSAGIWGVRLFSCKAARVRGPTRAGQVASDHLFFVTCKTQLLNSPSGGSKRSHADSCLGNTLGILWDVPFRSPEFRVPVAQLSYLTFNMLPGRLLNFSEVRILYFRDRICSHLSGIPRTL